MTLVKVATKDEIPQGGVKKVETEGKEILLANIDGEIFAINDICTHAQCNLTNGSLEGSEVTCPCHGAKFDVKSSKVTNPPANEDAESYTIKIEGNDVFIDL